MVPPEHTTLRAPEDAAGQRADRFLAEAIGTLSRSRVKALIEAGRRQPRRRPPRASPPSPCAPAASTASTCPPRSPPARRRRRSPSPILFEDEHLLVLDKPAGLVVHPAPGHEDGTLVNALLAHCGDTLPGIGGERRPGIVHRLDRDTSGVMVVAKTETALARLSADFAARDLERAYLALCWGAARARHRRGRGRRSAATRATASAWPCCARAARRR